MDLNAHVWFATTPYRNGRLVAAYSDPLHDDGLVVDLPVGSDVLSDPDALGVAEVIRVDDRERVARIHTRQRPRLADVPDLWYVLKDDTRDGVPALVLLAFADARRPAGAVSAQFEAVEVGAHYSQRAGSLRWLVGSGVVHQVEVVPDQQRRRVATRLLVAAELLRAVHGWPRINGGAERTVEGNGLIEALSGYAPERFHTWDAVAPSFVLTPAR